MSLNAQMTEHEKDCIAGMAGAVDGLAVRHAGEGGAGPRRVGGRVRAGGLSAAAGAHRPRPQPAPALPPLTLPRLAARLILRHPAQVDMMTIYTEYLQ